MAYRLASDPGYPIIDADTHVTEPGSLASTFRLREAGPRAVDGKHVAATWAIANGTMMAVGW